MASQFFSTLLSELPKELVSDLTSYFERGEGSEFYDPETNTAYLPQYGGFFTSGGQFVGDFGTLNDETLQSGGARRPTGFAAYNRIPGSKDNFDLTGRPMRTYDASGRLVDEGPMGGFHKNSPMDTILPFAMVLAPFAAAAMGAGAAGAAGGAASGSGAGAAGSIAGFGDAGLMYAGGDAAAAASLGGGASVAGGAALSASELAALGEAGITGFGDAGMMYGDPGAASGMTGVPPPANPYTSGAEYYLDKLSNLTPGGVAELVAKFGPGVAQIFAGLEGRKAAKSLQGQMQFPSMEELLYGGGGGAGGVPGLGPFAFPGVTDVTKMPGFQTGLEAVQRSLAAQGYQGSGNMMAALSEYGGGFYDKHFGQSLRAYEANRATQGQFVDQRLRANAQKVLAAQAQAGPVSGGLSSMALLANGVGKIAELFK